MKLEIVLINLFFMDRVKRWSKGFKMLILEKEMLVVLQKDLLHQKEVNPSLQIWDCNPDIPIIHNDDESLESDNIALKKELELAKPRKVVLSLMRKTYTHQCEYIKYWCTVISKVGRCSSHILRRKLIM